jgi:hypothetical protein
VDHGICCLEVLPLFSLWPKYEDGAMALSVECFNGIWFVSGNLEYLSLPGKADQSLLDGSCNRVRARCNGYTLARPQSLNSKFARGTRARAVLCARPGGFLKRLEQPTLLGVDRPTKLPDPPLASSISESAPRPRERLHDARDFLCNAFALVVGCALKLDQHVFLPGIERAENASERIFGWNQLGLFAPENRKLLGEPDPAPRAHHAIVDPVHLGDVGARSTHCDSPPLVIFAVERRLDIDQECGEWAVIPKRGPQPFNRFAQEHGRGRVGQVSEVGRDVVPRF